MNRRHHLGGNCLVVGTTTSAKSSVKTTDLLCQASEGKTSIVVVDPHKKSLGYWLVGHLYAMGLLYRVLYDRLSDLKRVIGWKFLEPSRAKNEIERRAENDERVDAFTGILCRRRGSSGLQSSPQIEEWTQHALNLSINQTEEIPLSALPFAFVPNHPTQQQFIENCVDEEIARVFRGIASGKIRRGIYAPAERLIASVCTSPAFAIRHGNFNLRKFLGNPLFPGILIVEGGSLGNVSFDAMRTMLGSVIHKVIHFVRNRPKPNPRIHLVIDEATNADLIGTYECRAMAETQKMGLDITMICQNLNFGSSFVQESILQNCMRHEWFYCGNAALAGIGASDLGSPEYKERLMTLPRGGRFVKHHRRVNFEQVKELSDPWHFPGLTEKKTEAAIKQIQQRPEYQDGKLVMRESFSKPKFIPAPSNNLPEGSSPLDRLDIDE